MSAFLQSGRFCHAKIAKLRVRFRPIADGLKRTGLSGFVWGAIGLVIALWQAGEHPKEALEKSPELNGFFEAV